MVDNDGNAQNITKKLCIIYLFGRSFGLQDHIDPWEGLCTRRTDEIPTVVFPTGYPLSPNGMPVTSRGLFQYKTKHEKSKQLINCEHCKNSFWILHMQWPRGNPSSDLFFNNHSIA